MTQKNIFVTGPPGCGKSTLIERVFQRIQGPMIGFFTREIREKGERVGFSITTLDGKKGVLAHENIRGRFRVGKYGVNITHIDQIAVPSMIPGNQDDIVVIDEIGKMECLSPLFRQTLIDILDSENPIIGSISQKGDRFIQNIKKKDDILLVEISESNRKELVNLSQFYEI